METTGKSVGVRRGPAGRGWRLAAVALVAAAAAAQAAAGADPWDSGDDSKPRKAVPSAPAPAKAPASKPKPSGEPPADGKRTLKDEARAVLAPSTAGPNSWTIALVAFRGDGAEESGRLALHKVQTEGGLPDAFSERRGDAVVICHGSFDTPDSTRAAQELKRVQSIEIGGQRPYAEAILSPPMNATNLGSQPQFNLVQAKAMQGDEALYTLQVAVYGRRDLMQPTEADLSEARKAAEVAALRFRQEGEQAYYYHGPRMSMVTIGVFGTEDFDPQTPSYKSTRLLDAQKRHPYNLYNGAGIKQKAPGDKEARLQPSTLVAIPSK